MDPRELVIGPPAASGDAKNLVAARLAPTLASVFTRPGISLNELCPRVWWCPQCLALMQTAVYKLAMCWSSAVHSNGRTRLVQHLAERCLLSLLLSLPRVPHTANLLIQDKDYTGTPLTPRTHVRTPRKPKALLFVSRLRCLHPSSQPFIFFPQTCSPS